MSNNIDLGGSLQQQGLDPDEVDKHAYSCKRCRRLKKKCTRTIPKCQNCVKAGELCEYVPRAPRRKKIEIMKSHNQQKSYTPHVPLAPNLSNSKYSNNLNYGNGSQPNPSSSNSVSTPFPSSSNSASTPFPSSNTYSYNSLNNNLNPSNNLNFSASNSTSNNANNAHFPLIPRARSASEGSTSSLKPFTYGTTDPLSYSQIETFNFAGLPPISSITNSMVGANNDFSNISQGFSFNNNLSQSFGSFNGTGTNNNNNNNNNNNQFPFHKIPSSAPSPQSSISSVDSHMIRRILPNNNASLQNRMLNSVMGINNSVPGTVIRPDFPRSLVNQCAEAFFTEFSRSYPFLKRTEYLERIHGIDFERLETMYPVDTFDLYMILLIGHCTLERKNKVPSDKSLKEYLVHKSLEQISLFLTYDNLSSIKQLMFLGIYSYFEESSFISWYIAGVITKLALSLGLNRKLSDPNIEEDCSEEDLEMRKRMFWSVYNFDRHISVSLGRPLGLDDDDINLDPYNPLPYEEPEEIDLFNSIVDLRRIEGKILKNVHSVNAGVRFKTEDEKIDVLNNLRKDIENWYSTISSVTCSNKRFSLSNFSVSWYSSCYYQMLYMLYRPSFLVPNPVHETMEVVGKACLQSIAYIYNLHQIHLLPLNWIQLYKLLALLTTLLHCLIIGSVDLMEVKSELALSVELGEYYSEKWTIARKIVTIIKQINHTIYDVKLGYGFNVLEREELTKKLILFGYKYYDALSESQVDFWYDDPIIANIRSIEV